jgi:DNA-binding response OmpR family regulator
MGSRSLDGCAATIRKKLELREENGLILRAVYRHGYQLVSLGTPHRTDVYA